MNCANHSDQAAVAFCRTCGKPLCQPMHPRRTRSHLLRIVPGRTHGRHPPAPGFVPPQTPPQTVYQQFMDQGLGRESCARSGHWAQSGSGGNSRRILSRSALALFIARSTRRDWPIWSIMVLLIIGVSSDVPWYMHMILGIGIGFFYLYQIIDAVRTAKAMQMGEPVPDPFGLAATFGAGEKFEATQGSGWSGRSDRPGHFVPVAHGRLVRSSAWDRFWFR